MKMARWTISTMLVALTAMVVVAPQWVNAMVGWKPLRAPTVAELDDPPSLEEREAPAFLADRDRVDVTVEEDTTVGAFLHRFHVPYDHVRRQIGAQVGVPDPADDHVLVAGQKLTLTLTPPRLP